MNDRRDKSADIGGIRVQTKRESAKRLVVLTL